AFVLVLEVEHDWQPEFRSRKPVRYVIPGCVPPHSTACNATDRLGFGVSRPTRSVRLLSRITSETDPLAKVPEQSDQPIPNPDRIARCVNRSEQNPFGNHRPFPNG